MLEQFLNDTFMGLPIPNKLQDIESSTELYESDNVYTAIIAVPGYVQENIELEAKEKSLKVILKPENNKKDFGRKLYGKLDNVVSRVIFFEKPIDINKISASLKDGILIIGCTKKENTESKKILITNI